MNKNTNPVKRMRLYKLHN